MLMMNSVLMDKKRKKMNILNLECFQVVDIRQRENHLKFFKRIWIYWNYLYVYLLYYLVIYSIFFLPSKGTFFSERTASFPFFFLSPRPYFFVLYSLHNVLHVISVCCCCCCCWTEPSERQRLEPWISTVSKIAHRFFFTFSLCQRATKHFANKNNSSEYSVKQQHNVTISQYLNLSELS